MFSRSVNHRTLKAALSAQRRCMSDTHVHIHLNINGVPTSGAQVGYAPAQQPHSIPALVTPAVTAPSPSSSVATAPAVIAPPAANFAAGGQVNFPANTRLLVCDMAGTTVDEQGIVYETLFNVMNKNGLGVQWEEMHPWHGASKIKVIEHFATRNKPDSMSEMGLAKHVDKMHDQFVHDIKVAYFEKDILKLIDPNLPNFIDNLRNNGIKFALNTGYPVDIQEAIMKKLNMFDFCDGYVSAQQVGGRPKPYMIQKLMYDLDIDNCLDVAKAGDSVADIGEGIKAGVGFNIGVLSGADDEKTLRDAGAMVIVNKVTDIGLGR